LVSPKYLSNDTWNSLITPQALMCSLNNRPKRFDNIVIDDISNTVVGFGSIDKELLTTQSQDQLRLFSNHQIIQAHLLQETEISPISSVRLIYQPLVEHKIPIDHFSWRDDWFWHNIGTWAEYDQAEESLSAYDIEHQTNRIVWSRYHKISHFSSMGLTSLCGEPVKSIFKSYKIKFLLGHINDYSEILMIIKKIKRKKIPLNLKSIPKFGTLFILYFKKSFWASHSFHNLLGNPHPVILDASAFREDPYNSEPQSEQGLALCLLPEE